MKLHEHLPPETLFELVSEDRVPADAASCPECGSEVESLRRFLTGLRRVDASMVATTEWDDLLLRRRIREAVAQEGPLRVSIFDRFQLLRPALASAFVAVIALVVVLPFGLAPAKSPSAVTAGVSPVNGSRLPAWTPLPDESEDEGLAVLAEWTPTEDEIAVAGCHGACLAGLSLPEEDHLRAAASAALPGGPVPVGSPL